MTIAQCGVMDTSSQAVYVRPQGLKVMLQPSCLHLPSLGLIKVPPIMAVMPVGKKGC
eukprot:CAMPEP_0206448920 /NCGR_PEP_ID=MMETSP0324_2-20121206/17778_1 /ASSEMBLY_ACC=CAM_ASM_000836 /TAXON_ID=2866 /ORGANISM="Crypthecodinium cohnii, Strain Seligo" /LENGTH=56 /DNA_ID=CAMNT_0053918193 /DNA_START=6 /DNA_END=177 /DNA_ORIENTATION=+